MTGDDAAQQLEHEADELEHHLEALQDHIDEAGKSAAALREKTDPETVGERHDVRRTPGQGNDPEGVAAGWSDSVEDASSSPSDAGDTQPTGSAADDAPSSSTTDGDDSDGDAPSSDTDDDSAETSHGDAGEAVGGPTPGHASGGDD
jgi:hypothetical protein